MKRLWVAGILLLCVLPAATAVAAPGMAAITVTPSSNGGETWSLSIQVLAMMTALSLLPAALISMTSFTRIIIVLAILRQALGTAQTPSNQILIGLSLFLTLFVMSPVFGEIYNNGVKPYLEETITPGEALEKSASPLRSFMLEQTRETDLGMFADIANYEQDDLQTPESVPFSLLVPAYVTSELKTAFQIGFLVLIPFLVIDLVVASVLMSMGMMMLSPMIISLPFKIMLFVLVDGWALIIGTLASSFYV
jgi:flagellar biosynthetic protein FliP